ncbi:hypothetical protein AGOR_G00047560 [Albula goreensis]|uniref:Uncharacterized protein n=1 Tax=Albula goreensis TaxID=1534307 RepID=A0A8T3DV06_9TELE|nr:hypothetical protein AGOR_G00047560 [Albula goreensis]
MARFGQGGNSAGGIHGGHPNLAPRPTPSPGSALQTRRGALENMLSGATAPSTPSHKPNFQKNNVSVSNSSPDESSGQEFPKPRALASKFETTSFPKPQPFKPKPLEPSQDNKPKPLFPKTPLKKPSAGNIVLDTTPASPKPPPPFAKPPFVKDDSKSMDDAGGGIPTPPKMPTFPKKSSNIQLQLNKGGVGESAGVKPHPVLAQKPSGFRAAQNAFNKDSGDREGEHETEEDSKTVNTPKPPTPHIPAAPKPLTAQKPGFAKRPLGSTSETDESSDPSAPKKKPLPKSFVLGSPPPKPDRPPNVNLEKFKKGLESVNDDSGKHGGLPPPPTSHPSNLEPPPRPRPPIRPFRASHLETQFSQMWKRAMTMLGC